MRHTSDVHQAARPRRAGFTLIELLVVISIIAVLMALSAAAYLRVSGTAQKSTTKTTMQRLDSRLRQQTAFFSDRGRESAVPPTVLQNLAGNDRERARAIWMKLQFRQTFPTTFAEALSPSPGYIAPRDGYVKHLAQYGITSGTAGAPLPHESAACLYMILRYGPETTGEDDTSMAGATKVVGGIPVLVDAWGNPLLFCRWPTGDPTTGVSPINPQGWQSGFKDPLDPRGTLSSKAWINAYGTNFANAVGYVPNNTPQGQSLNLTPVIVSAGPDKVFGVNLLTLQIAPGNQANDNIYSTDLR